MACETIYACTSAGSLTQATHVGIEAETVVVVDPGDAAAPGPADFIVTKFDLAVTVFGEDEHELLLLVGAAAAAFAVGTIGADGAAETLTVEDLFFEEVPGEMKFPEPDQGGKVPEFAVKGRVNWTAGETFADKLSAA